MGFVRFHENGSFTMYIIVTKYMIFKNGSFKQTLDRVKTYKSMNFRLTGTSFDKTNNSMQLYSICTYNEYISLFCSLIVIFIVEICSKDQFFMVGKSYLRLQSTTEFLPLGCDIPRPHNL